MKRNEMILFAVLIALLNWPLLMGGTAEEWLYVPGKVADGQIYRLLTCAFVHVSGYHLLLDGAAFFLLYHQLAEGRRSRRLFALLVIHAAVMTAVTLSLPFMNVDSYCGLSGIGHGLMALCGLEMLTGKEKTARRAGGICFALVLGKSILEVTTGQVFFGSLHFGSVGTPVLWSHLGGVLGGLLAYILLRTDKPYAFCDYYVYKYCIAKTRSTNGKIISNSK